MTRLRRRAPYPAAGLVLALLAACGASHPASGPGPARGTAATRGSAHAGAGAARFCALARSVGLDDVRSAGSATADPATLLAGIDAMDAVAPAGIKADFGVFDRLEHAVLDPAGAGAGRPAGPGAGIAASLQNVQTYLHTACGLPSR